MASVEFKVNFLRPDIVERGQVTARSRVLRRGRKVGVCEVELSQAGAVIAKGLFSYLLSARKKAGLEGKGMNSEELKALQAPLKEKYRDDPSRALVTLRAEGRIGEGVACHVETGRALVEAGLHPATGGTGAQACSGDMLLQALVACAGVTLGAVATALGIRLRDGRVEAEGDLDFRGTLGVAKDVPVGFGQIRLRFEIDTDEPPDRVADLIRLTERYCVVLQTLRRSPAVLVESSRG